MNADAFFSPWERLAAGWSECQEQINNIIKIATPDRELAWRGVVDASWPLHSSLYRRFIRANGHPPDEPDLVSFEERLLTDCRRRWRYDNLGALETLAHLQHYGGPTRLLDVSFNPLITLWFAVEQKRNAAGQPLPEVNGRIFAFDTTDRHIALNEGWGGYALPWSYSPGDHWRRDLPYVWWPPSYNERIPAQNSAFLVGGVPQVHSGGNMKYRKTPGDGAVGGTWTIDEVRAVSSVTIAMTSLARNPRIGSRPTFTIRINAAEKSELRQILEDRFGYNAASVYPDLFGLAQYGADGIPM
ncbi:FRG domain-containing protein [Actinoplanes sp. NPDC051859]|uniref:FRG domain-containing protein n=1 Tax=Actinoplanes sp. NPDC051859 TaxID=3363909 RepID=UPI0037A6AD11